MMESAPKPKRSRRAKPLIGADGVEETEEDMEYRLASTLPKSRKNPKLKGTIAPTNVYGPYAVPSSAPFYDLARVASTASELKGTTKKETEAAAFFKVSVLRHTKSHSSSCRRSVTAKRSGTQLTFSRTVCTPTTKSSI